MILRISIGVFLHSPELIDTFEKLKEDRLFFRSNIIVVEGGVAAAESFLADKQTPPLLIVETTGDEESIYEQLDGLANVCDPHTKVIIVGNVNDIVFYRSIIESGISDYLVNPATPEQIKTSVHNIFSGPSIADKKGKSIAFAGLSGGAGSSVISHNVAYEIAASKDQPVILIDLDVPYGTASLNFNLQSRQTIVDALTNIGSLDETYIDQYLLEYNPKISILPSPASFVLGMAITPEALSKIIKICKSISEYVIIDIPHVWHTWVSDILAESDEVVLIGKPDLTNLRNGKNMAEYLQPKRGVEAPTHLVLNQVGLAKKTDLDAKNFKDAVAMSPEVEIPYEPEAFGKALNNGEMMSVANPKSKATAAIKELTQLLIIEETEKKVEPEKKKFSLFKSKK